MSVLQGIRDRAAWIVSGAIAVALISFILQDAFKRNGPGFSNSSTIGKINGQAIERDDFESKVDFIDQMQQMNGTANTDRSVLENTAWNLMVNTALIDQETAKLGLGFTAKELNDILFGANPPDWVKQNFTDPSTGQINTDQLKSYLAQVKKQQNNPQAKLFEEANVDPISEKTIGQKYLALISGAVYIPKWVSEKTNADNNAIANISYAYVPYATINDSTLKISDDEINAYVKAHAKQFETKEETRVFSFVSFDASPSRDDSAAVLSELNELKPAFQKTDTSGITAFLASKGSAIPYDAGFVTKNNLKVPNADSIMALADGQVFGPYLDQQDYVLAKMMGHRTIPDSVKCRHILIKTEDQGRQVLDDSTALKRIDSIANAIKGGADFNAMVQKYSDDPGSKSTQGVYDFSSTQFSTLAQEFAQTIFFGKTGDKKIVHVSNSQYAGYHYIEVLNQKNFQPAYNIAYLAKAINASSETINSANNAAEQFAASSQSSTQFTANAAKQNKLVQTSAEIKENDYDLGVLGNNRQLVKWVYQNNVGDVSEPFSVQDGKSYVVVLITADNKAGLPSAAHARPLVQDILINQKKAEQIINTKIKGTTLPEIAQHAGVTVQTADSISFRQGILAGVGSEPKVVGAAFNKTLQGKVSSPIAANSGVFVIQGISIGAIPSLNGGAGELRIQLESQLKQQLGYDPLGALREAAEIKDYRSSFY